MTTWHITPVPVQFVKGLGYRSLFLCVITFHITAVTLPCMIKMLLHLWWFAPTAWHTHNWMSFFSYDIKYKLLKSCYVSFNWWFAVASHHNCLDFTWARWSWWFSLLPKTLCLYICMSVCLFVCLFSVFLCFHLKIFVSHLFHVKITKLDYHPFLEEQQYFSAFL